MRYVQLSESETQLLLQELQHYMHHKGYASARVAFDDGGFKVSVNQGMWSPAMGEERE